MRRSTPPDNWVVNLSSKQLSTPQKSVLARGLSFAPAPRKIPASRIVAAVEDGLRWINQPDADRVRTTVVAILNKARPPSMNLPPSESKALKNLQADDEIVVVPADKGRAVVVMDRLDYDSKINTLLSDQSTYQKLTRDPAPALERQMNELLLSLKRSGAIPPKLYDQLRSSAGKTPLFYGLPKNT